MSKFYPIKFANVAHRLLTEKNGVTTSINVLEDFIRKSEYDPTKENGWCNVRFNDQNVEDKVKASQYLSYVVRNISSDDEHTGTMSNFYNLYAQLRWINNKQVFKLNKKIIDKFLDYKDFLIPRNFYSRMPIRSFCLDLREMNNKFFEYVIVSIDETTVPDDYFYSIKTVCFKENPKDEHTHSAITIDESAVDKPIPFEAVNPREAKNDEQKSISQVQRITLAFILYYISHLKPDIAWFDDVMEEYVIEDKNALEASKSPHGEQMWFVGYNSEDK